MSFTIPTFCPHFLYIPNLYRGESKKKKKMEKEFVLIHKLHKN